jgi:transaldolase
MSRERMEGSGIFFDSANLEELKTWFDTRIIGGATTNPVILQKDNVLDIPAHVQKMIDITGPNFPISIEVPDSAMSRQEMVDLALAYRDRFPQNAVIKIPMDPRDPEKSFEVMYRLGQEGVRVNATLGLSMGQLVGASEALRKSHATGDNYISLFWGRRDEAKKKIVAGLVAGGMKEEEANERIPDAATTLAMTIKYLETHSLSPKIIIGSVRSADQIEKAFSLGADIVTIPPKLIKEWMYTERGVETADQFNQAYRDVKERIKLV